MLSAISVCSILAGLVLVKILDVVLEDEEIRAIQSMQLDAALIVPLDRTVNGFAVLEDDHHRRAGIHLFLVIEGLGVCLLRWDLLLRLRGLLWSLRLSLSLTSELSLLRSFVQLLLSLFDLSQCGAYELPVQVLLLDFWLPSSVFPWTWGGVSASTLRLLAVTSCSRVTRA